ncbi:helix-turn-helix domain-containing protein [Caproicibacter sp.]|uniref:helix-turn-helix domain-containing protein n=1 Tax=Caproicibacter sp. TaxID=2814884 RepID=UPI003988FDD4
MEFADRLQKLRKCRGLSQENLAQEMGVSRQAVSKWESGQSLPETEKMIALSDLFGVSLDTLIKGAKEDKSEEGSPRECAFHRYNRHYEYKSTRKLFGLPLVHVNLGRGLYTARGIVAVGNIAFGAVSVGGISVGILALGGLAFGMLAVAGFSAGLLLAIGGVAVGTVAVGGCAVGILSVGGLAVGKYALGGCALASDIAVGGYASAHIAVGDTVRGAYPFVIRDQDWNGYRTEQALRLIRQEYPALWGPLLHLFTALLG